MGKQYDLTGQRFGRLLVLKRDAEGKGRPWICCCDCGREKAVQTHPLLSGAVQSCGCLRSDRKVQDLEGQRFGKLRVEKRVRKEERGSSFWRCRCDCGEFCVVSAGNLKSERTKSCGCQQKVIQRRAWMKAIRSRKVLYQKGTDLCQWMQQPKKNNTSGIVGVTYDQSVGLWKASIEFQKERHYLGASKNKETAAKLREEAEEKIAQLLAGEGKWMSYSR